jgi:putative oxidoreductase
MPTRENLETWGVRVLSVARVGTGLLFFQHGAEKLWGFANGRMIGYNFTSLIGMAGPIEVIGGLFVVLGLFTRTTAFILCGEMAVAYFTAWAPRGFWPINNGGEEAALFCFIFLWLFTAGPGPWSLDHVLRRNDRIGSWEPHGRSLLRIVLAFLFSLHGYRHLFGAFPRIAGRRGAVPMALDALPSSFGVLEIAGGLLLLIGIFTRPTAVILSCELVVAYVYSALPRTIWPVRNGGDEVLLYFLAFVYLAAMGAGTLSWDDLRKKELAELVPADAGGHT